MSLVGGEEAGGSFDAILAGQEGVFQRRRVGDRRVEGADDSNGGIQILERFFLDDRGQALADAAGARVLVNDQDLAAVPGYARARRLAVQRGQRSQVENGDASIPPSADRESAARVHTWT